MTDFNADPLAHIDEVLAINSIAGSIRDATGLDPVFITGDPNLTPRQNAKGAAGVALQFVTPPAIERFVDRVLKSDFPETTNGDEA